MRRLGFPIAATMLVSLLVTVPAAAHEKGVLKPATRELAAGDSLSVSGEHFTKGATLELLLVGPRGRIPLGAVRTDSAGRFAGRVAVPAEVSEGAYRLVAVAADGDEVATVDVAVLAARTTDEMHAEATGAGAMEAMGEPSAAPLALDRARSGSVTVGVLALAAIAAIAGIVLMRRQA